MASEDSSAPVSRVEQDLEDRVFERKTPGSDTAAMAVGKKSAVEKRAAAWKDEDDAQVQVDIKASGRLRKLRKTISEEKVSGEVFQERLQNLQTVAEGGASEWGFLSKRLNKEDDTHSAEGDISEEEQDGFLQSSTAIVDQSTGNLPQGKLHVTRMKDANQHSPSRSVVQALEFHPNGQLMLSAGYDKSLKLFQVDGSTNSLIHSAFIPDMPIECASFNSSGTDIVLSGRRPHFYVYDVVNGNMKKIPKLLGRKEKSLNGFTLSNDGKWAVFLGSDGYLHVLSGSSYQWITSLKMNGQVLAACFSEDSKYLISCGSDGDVYKWDMRKRRCFSKHSDEGSLRSTAICASPCGSYYAVGSDSGVVNVYGGVSSAHSSAQSSAPIKSLMHLTTPVTSLKFNPDSQILAMSSKHLKDSMKLIHLPSFTSFSNWPTSRTPLHYVSTLSFSPQSGYFACGNDRGRVLLYRLNHYCRT